MPLRLGVGISPVFMLGGGASFSPSDLGAACIEWWDFRTGGTDAAITSHPGEKGVYALSQSNASYKPVWNAAGYCVWDASDDYLEFTLTSAIAAGQLWIETPWGWHKSGIGNWTATTHRLALPNATQVILVDTAVMTAGQIAQLETYMTGTQYWFIGKTLDTTIYNRFNNNPDVNYSILYRDASSSYSRNSSQAGETVDVVALGGLSAPIHVFYPIGIATDATLTNIRLDNNNLAGAVPMLSGISAAASIYYDRNMLAGVITSLSAILSLIELLARQNALTGNIPSLGSNVNLATVYTYNNLLQGYDGGGVSATLLNFRAYNNLLTAAAVNALLADFVAAGGASGTLNLGGTGNAAPTGQGLLDKATLTGLGWAVSTN